MKQVLFTVLHFRVEAPFLSSTTVSFFFFHYSSYKYAEMKYTLLLVVNDVLWYSMPLDSAVFIVYDVFKLVFMITRRPREKNIQDSRVLLYSYYMGFL